MSHQAKVAVVSGGSAGVGRAVLSRLIARGYRVGVLARGNDRLKEIEGEYGDAVLCLPCDMADAAEVTKAGAAIEEVLGPIGVWVNAAMATSFSPFLSMKSAEFNRIVQTTLMGVVNGTRTALALMETRNRGRIVNVGSALGYVSVPCQSAYCASKHAINGFTASIRSELLREGSAITVSLVQLPAINTPQFDWALNRLANRPQPAPPIFQPEVAARAVMRAIDEGKREYFVGRSVLRLIFGNMILPDYIQHKMADAGVEAQKSDEAEPGGRANNLEAPLEDVPARAEGRFGADANATGLVVDADRLRVGLFGGALLAFLVIGLLIG